MSVELLKRAAKELREHAAAAQADDWFAAGPWLKDCPLELAEMLPLGFVAAGVECIPVVLAPPDGELPTRASLDFVALMHPPVALALAEWLLMTAEHISEFASVAGLEREGDLTEVDEAALGLARAILREPS